MVHQAVEMEETGDLAVVTLGSQPTTSTTSTYIPVTLHQSATNPVFVFNCLSLSSLYSISLNTQVMSVMDLNL